MARSDQGKDYGNLPFPGLTGGDGQGNFYGEVVCGVTGPGTYGEVESLFKSDFNLSSNTSETGGIFFESNRRFFTNAYTYDRRDHDSDGDLDGPFLGMALTGTYAYPNVDFVIGSWLYYARGFTGGGFTGATTENGTRGYTADLGTADQLWVHPADLPATPYGEYSSIDGRTSNKLLHITSTGETHAANFGAANTNCLFSINYKPEGQPADRRLLSVTNFRHDDGPFNVSGPNDNRVFGSAIQTNNLRRINRGQLSLSQPDVAKHDDIDQKYLNEYTDLLFFFNGNPNQSTFPSGNVLKWNFPTPVRGFSIAVIDTDNNQNSSDADVGRIAQRFILEGDFKDGSTFSYIMYNRNIGGGDVSSALGSSGEGGTGISDIYLTGSNTNNKLDVVSYLALNQRTDKHIQNLYLSCFHQPVGITAGGNAHMDHGLTDMIGPARYYCNGGAFDGSVSPGTSGGLTLADALQQPHSGDDIVVKLSVMPYYEQGHWQKEKRGANVVHNDALFNEWRKIAQNQKGKTFGITGSRDGSGVFADFDFGPGVTFGASASTGSTLGITMGFRDGGDEFANYTSTPVEAFQYEVIKGTTVDGAFIPVWKKTRTL